MRFQFEVAQNKITVSCFPTENGDVYWATGTIPLTEKAAKETVLGLAQHRNGSAHTPQRDAFFEQAKQIFTDVQTAIIYELSLFYNTVNLTNFL